MATTRPARGAQNGQPLLCVGVVVCLCVGVLVYVGMHALNYMHVQPEPGGTVPLSIARVIDNQVYISMPPCRGALPEEILANGRPWRTTAPLLSMDRRTSRLETTISFVSPTR